MESVPEVWKDIPGFEGEFQVSNCGQVRGLDRVVIDKRGFARSLRGRLLKPTNHPNGYRIATLSGQKQRLIHRLVMLAFVGPQPLGTTDVNHKNGNKADNRIENLEYCTRKHNVSHAYETGLADNSGENNGRATATAEQVGRAYRLVAAGMTRKDAAAACGIGCHVVVAATSGRHWKLPPLPQRVSIRWTDEQIQRCMDMRDGGMSLMQIERATGVPNETVRRHWLKRQLTPA